MDMYLVVQQDIQKIWDPHLKLLLKGRQQNGNFQYLKCSSAPEVVVGLDGHLKWAENQLSIKQMADQEVYKKKLAWPWAAEIG